MNTNSAVCEISRIPRRSTRREFKNAAMPMKTAHSANMPGMRLGRWNTSAKICCTMRHIGHERAEHARVIAKV